MPIKYSLQAIFAAAVIAGASVSFGDLIDNNWGGLTNSNSNVSTTIEDTANWSEGRVPDVGDRAVFAMNGTTAGTLTIASTDGDFNPGAITVAATNNAVGPIALNKSLAMDDLTVTITGISSGTRASNRLELATTNDITLDLSGATPLDLSNGGDGMLNTGTGLTNVTTGTPGFRTTFNLSNANITFVTPSQSASTLVNGSAPFQGGGEVEGTSGTTTVTTQLNSQLNFTAVAGTVNFESTGARTSGTLDIGYTQMNVRSDQTWNADATSLLRMNYRLGTDAGSAPVLIGSLNDDGSLGTQRLDNLGQLHLEVDVSPLNATAATATRIVGGTYGSLEFASGASSNRTAVLVLQGDVEFASNGVQLGTYTGNVASNVAATSVPYGLILATSGGNSQNVQIILEDANNSNAPHTLTVDQGVWLDDDSGIRSANNNIATNLINAAGSVLTIEGDLLVQSVNQGANAFNGTDFGTRTMGIIGDAATVVNLGGDYIVNTASVSGSTGSGLSRSTVNLNGGATVHTYEVADASSKTTVATGPTGIAGGFSIGTLNVGTVITPATANIKLVNNFVNDNRIVSTTADSTGEKLIAGNLNVNAGSTLDVNGQNVLVGTSLFVDPVGTLDLDSGLALGDGDLVPFFVGTGDQTAAWNLFAAQVIDTTNAGDTFSAVLDGGNTVWEAHVPVAVPEPASLALLSGASLMLLVKRRRKGA